MFQMCYIYFERPHYYKFQMVSLLAGSSAYVIQIVHLSESFQSLDVSFEVLLECIQ